MTTATTGAKAHAIERMSAVLGDDWFDTQYVEELCDGIRHLLPSERREKHPAFDPEYHGAMMLFQNAE